MVDISIPQKPRFLPFFGSLLMSGAWHQSRLQCVVCKDRLSVQEKLSFDCWCKGTKKQVKMQECARHLNKLFFLSKNGRMSWIEKRSFPVMVIFGQNHFRGRSVILYYNINIYLYYNIAHFDRFHFHFDRKWPWPILTGFCFLHSKCLAYKV